MSQLPSEVLNRIKPVSTNNSLRQSTNVFAQTSIAAQYSYNFSWLDRPIIQYPQDMVVMQELIWELQPDLIIEITIAHGGLLIFSASMLALLDMCDAIESGKSMNPKVSNRKVLGIDIAIRAHNRAAIETHPMASRIQMIQGSNIAADIIAQVRAFAAKYKRVLVCLESNHTHDHVLAELNAYAQLTSVGSYCVVFDTLVEDLPKEMFPSRPCGPDNKPMTAVRREGNSIIQMPIKYKRWARTRQVPLFTYLHPAIT